MLETAHAHERRRDGQRAHERDCALRIAFEAGVHSLDGRRKIASELRLHQRCAGYDRDSTICCHLDERKICRTVVLGWRPDTFGHREIDGELNHSKVMIFAACLDCDRDDLSERQIVLVGWKDTEAIPCCASVATDRSVCSE